jgi:hypothetical protein
MVDYFAGSGVLAWTTITGIDFMFAVFTMITWNTSAFVVQDSLLATGSSVLAWVSVAHITLD